MIIGTPETDRFTKPHVRFLAIGSRPGWAGVSGSGVTARRTYCSALFWYMRLWSEGISASIADQTCWASRMQVQGSGSRQ